MKAIDKAVRIAGSQKRLGELCGVSQQRVWNWVNRDQSVPAEFCIAIERAVHGGVTRHDLRPDVYPIEKASVA